MPERVQRQRRAGEPGMTPGAIYVGRPSKWGNPWRIVVERHRGQTWHRVRHATEGRSAGSFVVPEYARRTATRAFYHDLIQGRLPFDEDDVTRDLAGHDLACWCPPAVLLPGGGRDWLGLQCHGDVLLEVANG
ncbi:DUF4326 domain-containing protein [Mycolicibacterium peregrinum]|uniref:DUF4326 domain-containing protein n=1 Tax=Mycolicibacterium peregrinum TaxID=43304 RepID=A0A4Z0HJP3_MYCPR|nr:DUF4326 domain-containing protein [Mycolicibacterium peregrinum]TGB37904.1 DUF4326 domain-containing protein [Mycolicibacterium peregrinum]TGB38077.1 DUF4326 domain-containing protein [Mycolicibacterium peregrinum]